MEVQSVRTFIGIDLGWYGKPSGLASIGLKDCSLRQRKIARLERVDDILGWVNQEVGDGAAVIAVDAPLIITNDSGIRRAERELNRDFRRFHAGCHAANLGRPFAANVLSFSHRLEALGFLHGPGITSRQEGRFQIEVHPHSASVELFGLDRIVKYKRGARDARAAGLRRLQRLMRTYLPRMEPPLDPHLPRVPKTGAIKPAEDMTDAVLCAFVAAHWWYWGKARNRVYGDRETGYIVTPCSNPVSRRD